MPSSPRLRVTDHAVARWVEHTGRQLPPDQARVEIRRCIAAGRPYKLRKVRDGVKTRMVPTGCCLLVFDGLDLVTVLARKD
jgi:hypothetical protein